MAVTRNLLSLAVARNSGTNVILVFRTKTAIGDGSYSSVAKRVETKGFLVDLTETAIQRLNDSGVSLVTGAILSIPYELEVAPDEVYYSGYRGRVVKFVISGNVTIMTLETAPIGLSEIV
jgi:hypothetical protein